MLPPKCQRPRCNNLTEQHKVKWKGYRKYCSKECSNLAKQENMRSTLMEKYGVTNVMMLSSTKEKIRETCQRKYGVDNPAQSSEIQSKMKSTIQERYGVGHQMHLAEVKDKIKKTSLDRYGTEYPTQSEVVKSQVRNTNLQNLGVENPFQSDEIKSKIMSERLKRHGVKHVAQVSVGPEVINTLTDRVKCSELYENSGISGICDYTGAKRALVIKYLKIHGIISEKSPSFFENEVNDFIRTLGYETVTRSRKIITPYEIDIFIPGKNIAFECNGTYWHSELQGKDRQYHKSKTEACAALGITLIHIWDHDWYSRNHLLKSRIKSKLGNIDKVYARHTVVREITHTDASTFLNEHHFQKSSMSSLNFGLFYESDLIGVMTFGKSRFNKAYEYELLRLCYTKDISVVGGASKLFTHFVKHYRPTSVISYSDRSWNTGQVYQAIGFKYSHSTAPAYRYTNDYINFENRVAYQKHKLSEKLDTFDPTLTEWENMQANGYDRIWDCGNDVWIWLT